MAKKKLTVKELEATRKGINKDEEDEKKAKAQGVKNSAPVYTYKDTNVTASDVAKRFNVQLPNKTDSTGSNTAPGANAKAPTSGPAYTKKVEDMFAQSKLYAAQGTEYVLDLANSIISGAATKPDKGNLGALDIDSIHDMTKISSDVARMLTDAGIFNIREIATNPLYAHLAQQEYRKSLLPTLQGELTNSQKADEANKAAQEEYEAKLRGMNADYSKQAEKAAQWKNFFSLLGENPTLEDKLRAAGIATGQTYDMGVFRGMDKYTAYEKKLALDNWFAGLDAAALSATPVVEEPEAPKYTSKTAGIQDEIGTLEKYINAYQTLEELTAYARSNPNFATDSMYTAPDYSDLSAWERFLMPQMGGAYADNALAAYINTGEVDPYFSQAQGSADYYKNWEELGYDYMLDQDKEIWNVLRKMDPAKADAYLQALSQIYLLPTRAQGYRAWDETVATNPWTAAPAWAGSVLQGVGNILDVPQQFAEAWAGVDNPYSAAFDNLNRQGYTRGAQLGAIRESDMPDWLKTASEYAYQGVSGFADNTARLLASGMNPTASLIMAGLQTSSHSLHESAERDDVSGAAKIIKAIGAGAIEVGTEKIGLDALFDMGKTGAKKYLSVVLSELGEESLNAASEPALEAVVAFLFDHEADIKSGPEFFENLKDTAITTFISASLSGGGAVASDYLDTHSYGKGIVNNGDADTILKIAQGMAEDSESKNIADAITGKQGKGKKPSFHQFGQLTKALVKDLGAEHADIINRVQDNAIAERLQELGDDAETAKKNAPAIRKVYRGEKLTMDERAAVRWNDRADKVTKELIRENNYTGDQPVPIKWVKGMKETQASETADVIGKQLQVQVATMTPIGKAANRAEEAAKKRVPKRDGKPKLATDSHVTFRASDGSAEISGDIMRFEESEDGMDVVVQTGKGKEGEQKVKLEDWISADGDGVATILSYVGDEQLPHSVTAEEANTLMQVYKHSGGNAKAVIQAFDVNYLAGYSGNNQVGSVLDPALSKIAYENGKRDAEKDEAQRKQRASEYKALENPVAGWIGKVTERNQVRGLGDADALQEAMKAMPESQRTAAEIMIETGKAVGLNVVLYDSDGKGAANDIQNGMFEGATHTVYFDVSAWAGNEKRVQALKKEGTLGYALLRVGGHELTHYLEVAAPEAYAKYSKAVKDALKAKGVDFAVRMREHIDKANAQGRKLTMGEAAAEVIADASEDMLQDSKLFNSLDTDTKGKIRAFLQHFAQKVKEIFQHLTGGHKESAALREMKDGVYHYLEGLQDLWDAGFDEILAKGTEEQSGGYTRQRRSHAGTEIDAESPVGTRGVGKHAAKDEGGVYANYYGKHAPALEVAKGTEEQSGDATEMVEGQEVKYSPRDMADADVTEMTLEDGKNNLKYVKQLFVKNDRSENHMYIPIAGSLNKGFLDLVKQPDLPVVMQVAKGMQAMAPEKTQINGGHGHNLTPAEIMSAIERLNEETAAFYNDKAIRWATVSESNTGKTIILFFDFGKHINPEYLYGIKTTGDHVLVTAFTREDEDNAYGYLEKGGYTKTPDAEVAGARISPSHANRVPNNSVPQSAANVNPDVKNSDRDQPDGVTIREFLESAGDDAASTVEEKNALQIYRDKLNVYHTATAEVEAAETALKAVRSMAQDSEREGTAEGRTKGAIKAEWIPKIEAAERRVDTARVKQRQAYNKLVAIEETPHVQSVFGWARQFLTESLAGTPEEIEARQAETDKVLSELEAQYESLKAAGRTQAASESKRRSELYRRMSKAFRSDAAEALKAAKVEYREREKKAREYRKTRDEVDKLRKGIGRKVKRLNTLRVRETDQKHVPQELQHVADAVMSTFTESELGRLVFHEAKLMNLGHTYRLLRQSKTDAAYFWDDEIETDIENLKSLSEAYGALRNREGNAPSRFSLEGVELETEILQGVDAIVSHVLNMIDATNTGFLYQRNETFTQFANKAGEKLRGHKDYKNLKGALGRIQHMLDENLRTGNTTPVYFFEHLENQEIMDVFDEIRKGMRQAAIIEREGKHFIEKAREQYNYGSWVADGKLTMKTGQGHTIELTREEAAEIYAIAKREAANKLYQTEHLLYGGFNYKHIDEKGKGLVRVKDESHQLDKADIAKISSWLTAEQKAYADALVGFLSTDMADYGNDASMKMYGYKKFTEQYYIPFHTVKNQLFQKGDEGPQGENAGTGRVKNSGFTHKVQYKANQALYVGGISETVADHIHKMAAYAAMVEPIENMKRLLNHKMLETDGTSNTIRALIGQKYGQASEDYMTQLLKDLNGATMGDKRASGLTDKMIGAFKRGAVMASASVVLQQPTAMARAMAMISPKYFTNNPFYRPSKGTWEEMLEHSGTAVIKDMGKFDVGMGMTATQYILDEDLNVVEAYQRLKAESKTKAGKAAYDRFMAWLTAAPGVADQWTWGLIWKAVKDEQADLHPDMDQASDAFLDLVGERFDDVIDHTQVYDSVLSRSNLMRSQDGIAKAITVFKSEPTLSLNMLYDALSGWKSKRHTGLHRGRIIGSVMASQILAGAMAALVQAWNDDDDKRTAIEKYADRATGNIVDNLNPLKMIPLVSDIVSMCEGYDVARPDMEIVGDVINYSKSFFDKAFDPDKALGWKDYENFLGTIANMVGIPAKNLLREGRRTWNAVVNTQWTAPTGINVGQAMLENMPFYRSKNNEYYQRIVTAKVRGDDELAEDLRTYMLTSKMVKEETLTEGIREAYQARYEKGGIEKDGAINFLLENNLVTGDTEAERKKSAYQYVDKWEEGTENYSAYNTLKDAYGEIDYNAISKAWKELTNYGYTDEQVKEESRKLLRKLVEAGTITPNQATQILRKWCSYKKDSDNLEKPREWIKNKK